MRISVPVEDGDPIEFECADSWISRWTSEGILTGGTYPHLPFVGGVEVIVDAGANCGAATVHFARHHPDAVIHSVEPSSRARAFLERNTAGRPNVVVHPIGLHSEDGEVLLYSSGDGDIGQSSIVAGADSRVEESETVTLRAAGAWALEQGLDRIDILKVDVEGCEVEVLESLASLLAEVKVLYVEYDSRGARRRIFEILEPTHDLYFAKMLALDQGETVWLRRDLADLPAATGHLRRLFGLVDPPPADAPRVDPS